MSWRWLATIVILPGTVLVVVPVLILGAADGTWWGAAPLRAADWSVWAGFAVAAPGLVVAGWTMRLFGKTGSGTPAPWDPIRTLVVEGPYRHVRNPMITSVFVMLAGETLAFRSPGIAAWTAFAVIANIIYMPLVEEPGLAARYGEDYRRYKAHVPRWMPRLRPWRGGDPTTC